MLDYIVLFVLDAACMILELVAARLMSPYFGNSNFVWTAIIGIILLAGCLGNLLGGKLASRQNTRFVVSLLLLLAVIYIVLTPLLATPVLESFSSSGAGVQGASVVSSIIFFLIPSTILGIVPPVIMKERIGKGNEKEKAQESGRTTAAIAFGSLVGTFAGGFWLIPALGTKMIFVLIAVMVFLVIPLLKPLKNTKERFSKVGFCILAGIAALILLSSFAVVQNENSIEKNRVSIDTEYGRIIIEDGKYRDQDVRYYKQSGAYSSATFLQKEKRNELVFDYLEKYNQMFEFLDVNNVAMIGGAAYQYPKYYVSHFPDKTIDVIEIDPMSTEIAKKYFFLDDLIREYGTDRLGLYNDDGRIFLSKSKKTYDAILNDAFSGEVPVGTLATVEAADIIKNRLTPGGVYMSNILGAVDGNKGKFLRSEVKTLQQIFDFVYVLPMKDDTAEKYTNWMIVATDNDKYIPDDTIEVTLTDEEIILTDDYCPIDSLTGTFYSEQYE